MYVRVNKLLRASNLTEEELASLMNLETISPNAKLGIVESVKEIAVVDLCMNSETLLSIRDSINAELKARLAVKEQEYLSFRDRVTSL